MGLRARILSTGDEIVSGATLDTNANWLAGELWRRGVEVVGLAAAADDLDALTRMLSEAGRDAELVVVTGGLGPTDDDLTAEAAARAAGVPLREHAEALRQVRERFEHLGRPMTPSNLKQALLPEGSELLSNPVGTAPGFAVSIGSGRAWFFPGVPRELHAMAELHLLPWVEAQGCAAPLRRRLHVCGQGESALQDRLRAVELPEGVRLGFKTWLPYNTVLLYADAALPDGGTRLEQARRAVAAVLAGDLFGEDDETLPGVVGRALAERGWSLALAESCTAGMASALLTEVAGSSEWFRGGVVAYANEVKQAVLGVPSELLERHGAVSEPCARAMAEGVRRVAGADVGLAITGIAGPGGGTPAKPVGLVCFGLAEPGATRTREVRYGDRGRDVVRRVAAAWSLEWLRRRLTGS